MKNRNLFKFILVLVDVLLMYGALFLTLILRYKGEFNIFFVHFSFLFLLWISFLFALNFYEMPPFKKIFTFFYNLIIFAVLAGTTGIAYFYLQPRLAITPKTILILDVLFFCFFLFIWRYLINRFLELQNFREKIVVVGFRPELNGELLNLVLQNGYEIIAFFNKNSSNESITASKSSKFGFVSDISALEEIIKKENVSSVVFAFDPHKNGETIREMFSVLPLRLNYISFTSFYESLTKKVLTEAIDEVWFLENISRPEKKFNEVIKRSFDIFFSSIGILITLILFPLIAFAVKINSPGSIFYYQKRVGKDGKVFTLYKFRTMKVSTEDGILWTILNDPRITSVGKILRKLHLDETPQFWNILKGDISFVGPRPERTKLAKIYEKEIPFYWQRYLIRPGFTGWAQLHYPASASIEEVKEKFQYDLYYIKNRSFLLDLSIILKTIQIIFK